MLATIKASSISGKTVITEPKLNSNMVKEAIRKWVKRQMFWPKDLSPDILAQNLQVVYVAHWLISGSASGEWSASIGSDTRRKEICPTCKGTGKVDGGVGICFNCDSENMIEKTYTTWHSGSGFVQASVDGVVFENLSKGHKIRCGKRDFSATASPLSNPETEVLQPEAVGDAAGKSLAERVLQEALEKNAGNAANQAGDHYKGLSIGRVSEQSIDAKTWLYPLYRGEYNFNGEVRHVEVDGMTGETYAEVPSSVSRKKTILVMGIVIGVIIIGFTVAYATGMIR